MGPLCALWVVVTLLEALKGWAPSPLLAVAQVLKSFHKDKFQGEWFVLGLAGSTHSKADRSLLSPFTATFEQNAKNQLEVSYAMTRGNQRCITWSYVLISKSQPGKFSVENREPGADTEEVQVHNTDYTTFALMSSRRRSGSQSILRVHLLCRAWAIPTQLLDKFVCLVRAQGLLDANIVFPDLAAPAPPALSPRI
ncbi:PREDICTED: epididymal-specific lipocalin-12 [Miniopterus natalensis]|uniref:epididymal-specific lipocalin-12 n=1 Tax=Miniopterus natalensis TaxID=291302 RepID=UPI0007A714F0|nr:PREDICTED: epididymal-specific lipocalin-12 [Miniopterus natalensis]